MISPGEITILHDMEYGEIPGFGPMQRVSEVLHEEVPGRVQESLAGGRMTLVSEPPGRGSEGASMPSLHGELMGWVEQAGAGPIQSPRCRRNTIPHPTP